MKTAIDYLKTLGIKCDKQGNILSKLPIGERGLTIVDMLEEKTTNEQEEYCYTIIDNKLVKIDI